MEPHARHPSLWLKHAIDSVCAFVLLLLTAPLFLLIAAAICLDSPGFPLFLQERIGRGGRAFTIFKFRTMRTGTEHEGLGMTTAADDARITRIGGLLRATGLDELPQLLNIVRGEMSFIGPRPTLRPQVEAYTPRQAERLRMRPGVTGWAQVNGRNSIPWSERIELDLHYIDHYSLGLDLRILWQTLLVLVRQRGVYSLDGPNDAFVKDPRGPTDPSAETCTRTAEEPAALDGNPSIAGAHSLIVIGAGGHSSVVIDAIEKQGLYHIVGLIDDNLDEPAGRPFDYPLLGDADALGLPGTPRRAVVAIGAPRARELWCARLEALGFELPTVVHPSAQVGRDVTIGAGSVLLAGAIVNPRARLGRGVIINTAASVDHDCVIGDFAHVAPGARVAGGVRIGARTHLGIGASVIQSVEIGVDVVVGAGAAVVSSIPDDVTVVGVPARPMSRGNPVRSVNSTLRT